MLILRLPRLPFSAAFDILFRHGGFAAFVRVHGSNVEAMYQFWRIFFVSSPIGKLNPRTIGQWVDIMCTCHVVQSLPHPVHAIYLLRPMRYEIPESMEAWRIAGLGAIFDTETLILAMRVFTPRGHQPLLQREWFWVSDVHQKRPLHEWLRFADEVISNHFFTRYWWTQQKEGPFYLLDSGECSMLDVIDKLARREILNLKRCLAREEKASMVIDIRRAKAKREWMKSTDKSPKHTAATSPPPITSAHKSEIDRLTNLRYAKYTLTLAQVKSIFSSMSTTTLDTKFKRILCLVTSLCRQFPRIKWSIKQALQTAMEETGRSNWDVERELYRVMYRQDVDPLKKLMLLVADERKK